MRSRTQPLHLITTLAAVSLLTACGALGGGSGGSKPATTAATPATAAPATPKIGPGMNANGEVTNPKLVEAGFGQKVKGEGDWEGEITGKPVPGSKFNQLKIGMSSGQVMGIMGQPTDQGAHITGKAFIPFYFGSDRYRYEVVYKGVGRLLFAGGAGWGWDGSQHLIWIIHSAAETGVR
jgi:hypothetical protein